MAVTILKKPMLPPTSLLIAEMSVPQRRVVRVQKVEGSSVALCRRDSYGPP